MKKNRWTFNGIKQYYPEIKFKDWLYLCSKGKQFKTLPSEVVSGIFELISENCE